ncbi:MAG: amidohydrolase [Clostridia bacterium]
MILIKNASYLVQNQDEILENVDILVKDNKIFKIGKDLGLNYPYEKVIDATNKIVAPGFINMHTHLYQNMLKGMRDDLGLKDWCENVTFPFAMIIRSQDKEHNNQDLAYYYGLLGAIEMLKSGITTFVDMDIIYDSLFQSWQDLGVRGIGAIQAVNRWVPKELMDTDEKRMEGIKATVEKWHNQGILKVAIAPSTPFACTPDFLEWLKNLSIEKDLGIYIHISETLWEVEQSLADCGLTPLAYLDSINFLSKQICAIHGVHFTEKEMQIAKEKQVTICYNPKSNAKLGSGIAPMVEYKKLGIDICLATDGAASNDLLDIFEEMRFGVMLQKAKYQDPACFIAEDIYQMATKAGAKYLDIDAGELKEGKLADIIILATEEAHFAPVHNIIQQIVYCGKEKSVETVLINGKIVMEDRKIKGVDESSAVKKAVELAKQRYGETSRKKLSAEF